MREPRVVLVGVGRLLLLAGLLALACGCSGNGGGGGKDGGSDGGATKPKPGWDLFYDSTVYNREQVLLIDLFATSGNTGGAGPFISPGVGDPWLDDITDRTLSLTDDDGDGHGDVQAIFAISGDTVTITGTGNATSGGTFGADVSGNTAGMTWCYTPTSKWASVRFTMSMTDTVTVSGQYSNAVASFDKDASTSCADQQYMQAGQPGSYTTGCTTAYVDVPTDPGTGQACIDSAAIKWDVYWEASAGDANDAGNGSASVNVTFTVTATQTP